MAKAQAGFDQLHADAVNSNAYARAVERLSAHPGTWLITGVAGFVGSNLLETLLRFNQRVVGVDNYSTGFRCNLEEVRQMVGPARWSSFHQIDGDIRDSETCTRAAKGVDYILHQAALGSVSRSLGDPADSHSCNVTGTLNMLLAAQANAVKRFVFASSSSVYGDHPGLPKLEENTGRCLSPYAATKLMGEIYAGVFAKCYELQAIGLRYFNVFGPRQDPNGEYAAVIPRWVAAMLRNEPAFINGDGETSRDFCYVGNAVQANILAATVDDPKALNQVYNIAVGARTSLNQLFEMLRQTLLSHHPHLQNYQPVYRAFRTGDIRHSQADISRARRLLGYEPSHNVRRGLAEALDWYQRHLPSPAAASQADFASVRVRC